MGGGKRACDSCKIEASELFCHTDSAFLCLACDSRFHALMSRHERVHLCDVCEQAPAVVTCKADAAALCAVCDRDIHTANPLARRHDRVPIIPFHDTPNNDYLSDSEEAASWLLPNPKDELKPSEYLFSDDVDSYLDLDLMAGASDQKPPPVSHQQVYVSPAVADGVVPVVDGKSRNDGVAPSMVEGVPCYDDMDYGGSKPFLVYNFNSQTVTQSVSSSSLEVGVVPDHNTMADVSTTSLGHETVPLTGIDREARVMRYREKKKNRKFEKTIRYASRKAYAETRPRIKGRFAKRTELVDLSGYDIVPTF